MTLFKTVLQGILIGIANIIPGVSGGTMAVILGIYDQVIQSISGFFSRSIQFSYFTFLFQLMVGAILGIFLFSHIISYLLDFHMEVTHFFFFGSYYRQFSCCLYFLRQYAS